jgi:hypothetical protein
VELQDAGPQKCVRGERVEAKTRPLDQHHPQAAASQKHRRGRPGDSSADDGHVVCVIQAARELSLHV